MSLSKLSIQKQHDYFFKERQNRNSKMIDWARETFPIRTSAPCSFAGGGEAADGEVCLDKGKGK